MAEKKILTFILYIKWNAYRSCKDFKRTPKTAANYWQHTVQIYKSINIINENYCIIFQLRFSNCVREYKKIIHIPLPARINRGTQVTQWDTALAVSMDTHYVVSRESLTQTHGHTDTREDPHNNGFSGNVKYPGTRGRN